MKDHDHQLTRYVLYGVVIFWLLVILGAMHVRG